MQVIKARNVNEAMELAIGLFGQIGELVPSRNGDTLEIPEPVATIYQFPWERVMLSANRDANPFFHLMESMWILAGRQDVGFLTEFVKRMAEFSDDGEFFNAPYGHRMRNTFGVDQIVQVTNILKADPNSRQAVIQIWDPKDLNKTTKDKACNMQVVFRIRNGQLDMTVYNRSNDMLWGAYGANVVQFSMLQEYVAAHLGDVGVGTYTQISNAFHVYLDGPGGKLWDRLSQSYVDERLYEGKVNNMVYIEPFDVEFFDKDLGTLFSLYDWGGLQAVYDAPDCTWLSQYFKHLVIPVVAVFWLYKTQSAQVALRYLQNIQADDWRMACEDWIINRKKVKS